VYIKLKSETWDGLNERTRHLGPKSFLVWGFLFFSSVFWKISKQIFETNFWNKFLFTFFPPRISTFCQNSFPRHVNYPSLPRIWFYNPIIINRTITLSPWHLIFLINFHKLNSCTKFHNPSIGLRMAKARMFYIYTLIFETIYPISSQNTPPYPIFLIFILPLTDKPPFSFDLIITNRYISSIIHCGLIHAPITPNYRPFFTKYHLTFSTISCHHRSVILWWVHFWILLRLATLYDQIHPSLHQKPPKRFL